MTPTITYADAGNNIVRHATEGRLIQGKWHKRNGQELACLLGAIHTDVESQADACAATGMPEWLAFLTVRLFDGLPSDRIAEFGERYGTSMRGWASIDAAAWKRVETKFKMFCIRQALEAARPKGDIPEYWPAVEAACLQTLEAMESGDEKALIAARAAAYAAARAAADAAADAAARAADAADAAARAAARAAYAAQFEALITFIDQEITP
jgi:hypothetical protein